MSSTWKLVNGDVILYDGPDVIEANNKFKLLKAEKADLSKISIFRSGKQIKPNSLAIYSGAAAKGTLSDHPSKPKSESEVIDEKYEKRWNPKPIVDGEIEKLKAEIISIVNREDVIIRVYKNILGVLAINLIVNGSHKLFTLEGGYTKRQFDLAIVQIKKVLE